MVYENTVGSGYSVWENIMSRPLLSSLFSFVWEWVGGLQKTPPQPTVVEVATGADESVPVAEEVQVPDHVPNGAEPAHSLT